MKRRFRILSYLALAIATAIILLLFANGIPAGSPNRAIALAKPFDSFPENQAQFVDFRLDEQSFAILTEREKQDQLRDWLLFAIVSDPSLTAAEINQSLYDLSVVRQGYMRPVSNFEYGTTRSLYVGNGEVVALIPAGMKAGQRTDALAHIADKHRKDLGKQPTSLVVFEYELHLDQQYGLLTRRDVVDAKTLFETAGGYVETPVDTLDELQQFMAQIDDLTYVQQQQEGLILGGRKLQGDTYQGIRIEDVAAIWQSEDKIRRDLDAFEAKWNTKLNLALPSERDGIEAAAYREMAELGLVNGSGFSLDPAYDYRAFEAAFKEISPKLEQYISRQQTTVTPEDVQAAKAGLAKDDVVPYLILTDKLQQSEDQLAQFIGGYLEAGGEGYRLQKARYDGDLQGTEVGMVLFYTDLLAKLWALNYQNSTPQDAVPDFAPLPAISSQVASIYKQEIKKLPSTRVWFGPQDKGFQASAAGRSLLFARNATRVYAASSNPLKPGEETFASANSDAFLGWWNDHYEEVAAYEPAYQRLNEIMKWSLLVSWLYEANQGSQLDFLKNVQVQRDFWFPDWAKAQGDRLRFKDWQSVQFYPKGHLGTATETMPILQSQPYTFFGEPNWYISGGVSLADEALFQGRKALPSLDDVDTLAYRSTIDYSTLNAVDNQLRFKSLEGTAYRLFDEQTTLASVAAKAKEGSKLRGRLSELGNLEFVRDLARTDDGLNVSTFVGKTELGRLQTARTGNGFKVGWLGRDIDDGQLLAQQIQQSADQSLEVLLNDNPMVAAAAEINDGSYAVKLQGSDDWMQMAAGDGGSNLPPDWQARVGSFPDDPSSIDNMLLRWVDDEQMQKQFQDGTAKLFIDKTLDASSPLNPDDLIHHLRQRNYDQVAQQIVADPQQAHKIAQQHIKAELKIIDSLRQNNQPARALERLDHLIATYGNQPDLMVEKVLLEIERQRLVAWRIDPAGAIADPGSSQANFYENIQRVFNSDRPNFKAVITDEEVIYIQDSPGFNNIDPSTPIDSSFPFGSEARAYRLESGSIGDAHIGGGGYDDPVASLVFSGDGGNGGSPSQTFNLGNYPNPTTGGSVASDDSCKEEAPDQETTKDNPCPRQVYVVVDDA